MTSETAEAQFGLKMMLLTLILSAIAGGASAQVLGPEIPIWDDSVESYQPEVAFSILHEEFLVVWHNIQGPDSADIYARRIGIDGTPGAFFSVFATPGEEHAFPSVSYNNLRDEYFVAWQFEYSAGDVDILGSIVSWDGSTVGSPFVINSDPEYQAEPDVAFNPNDDEYLVVYTNAWAGGLIDVAAQRVDGDGTLLSWANIASSAGAQRHSVTADFSPELDGYLIGYSRVSGSVAAYDVVGKLAAPDLAGVSVAPEIVIVDDAGDDASNPAVAASADGFIAQYNLSIDARARRLAGDATPLGPADGFPLGNQNSVAVGYPMQANAVARADAIGFVSAWHQYVPMGADVYAQAVSPHSDMVLSSPVPVAVGAADEQRVDIACAPWGTCLVVYQSDNDIAGRIINFNIFGDGFETGDSRYWTSTAPY